jgi:FKBP-type peptidyl-prolyl cis-trans isomerase
MTSATLRRITFLTLTLLGLVATPLLRAQREKLPMADLEIVEKKWPNAKRTFTGLRYVVLKPATDPKSPTPVGGMVAKVLYKGMLIDGTVFDQSPDVNTPLLAHVDRGELIQGWDEALQHMHRGEKWLLIVPPELAYGARGKPPVIPRDATLIFEMELLDFGKK